MALPVIGALIVYTDTPLNNLAWLDNFTQVVNWLADGNGDLNISTVKLKPRTTAQLNALTVTEGTLGYNSDIHRPVFYDGQKWTNL